MLTKIKIMIVDDNIATCENLRCLLELEPDMKVVGEANDGAAALDMAKRLTPDVILMDINMPVLDGIQATEKITTQLPDIAVIVLSIQGEEEYLKKAFEAGAKGYLTKPPDSLELVNEVYRVLS